MGRIELRDRYLYIGPTGHKVRMLRTVDDVRAFVEEVTFQSRRREFFIGDLSTLSREALGPLLKFIEETHHAVACYASKDNLPPTIISRFVHVEKLRSYRVGLDGFDAFVYAVEGGDDDKGTRLTPTPELLLSIAPTSFFKYAVYTKLNLKMRSRVGRIL